MPRALTYYKRARGNNMPGCWNLPSFKNSISAWNLFYKKYSWQLSLSFFCVFQTKFAMQSITCLISFFIVDKRIRITRLILRNGMWRSWCPNTPRRAQTGATSGCRPRTLCRHVIARERNDRRNLRILPKDIRLPRRLRGGSQRVTQRVMTKK